MKISKDDRRLSKELFRASLADGRIDPTKVRVISAKLIQSKPRNYVGILKDYQHLIRLEVEKHHAVIESATQLDEKTGKQLERDLRAKYGADLTTEFRTTPELIGGLRVKLGSHVWDSSVRSRLDRLETQLARA